MGAEGGKLLADAIKAHPNYSKIALNMFDGKTDVDMSRQRFQPSGLDIGDAHIIAEVLQHNPQLTKLDLSDNVHMVSPEHDYGIGDYRSSGIQALISAFKATPSLTSVSLSGVWGSHSKSYGKQAFEDDRAALRAAFAGRPGVLVLKDPKWDK